MAEKLKVDLSKPIEETPYWKGKGKRTYLSRLCRQGKFEEARKLCEALGIEYPPFAPESMQRTPSIPSSLANEKSPAVSHGEQGEPATGLGDVPAAIAPAAPSVPIETAPQAPIGGGESGDVLGIPGASDPAPSPHPLPASPQEAYKLERKARIVGKCVNHRLLRIEFLDNQERAVMYKIRQNYGMNDVVNVEWVEGAPEVNAMYREIWRPVG